MPQISIIKYSDILKENRCDAEFHRNLFFNKNLEYVRIGEILSFIQYGISIEMNEDKKGFKIYRMNEIENMFCKSEIKKFANISVEEMKKFKLKDKDVLFNRTNSFQFVGRTGIFKKFSTEDLIFASYLVRIRTDETKVLPEYLVTFLNTKFGIADIKRRARISINQSNVSAEELKKIKIPLIDIKIQKEIKNYFDTSYQKQTQSKQLYKEAEKALLRELDLLPANRSIGEGGDYKSEHILSFQTTKKETDEARRFDAEYFQPKYDEIIKKIENYKNGFDNLKYFIKDYSTGFPFKSDSYVDKGCYLIRINNIEKGKLNLENANRIPTDDKELSKKDIAKENDILISMSGTIGNACKIPNGIEAVINQRIFRFTPKNFNEEVLTLLINSIIGFTQLNRIGTGGVQTNISGNDIKKIKIPLIKPQVQKRIAKKIQESHKLRKESKELLEEAKRKVEEEIEKSSGI